MARPPRGGIVTDTKFPPGVELVLHRVDRRQEVFGGGIEHRHQHRNKRRLGHPGYFRDDSAASVGIDAVVLCDPGGIVARDITHVGVQRTQQAVQPVSQAGRQVGRRARQTTKCGRRPVAGNRCSDASHEAGA